MHNTVDGQNESFSLRSVFFFDATIASTQTKARMLPVVRGMKFKVLSQPLGELSILTKQGVRKQYGLASWWRHHP
jgi:hypothetical protein